VRYLGAACSLVRGNRKCLQNPGGETSRKIEKEMGEQHSDKF